MNSPRRGARRVLRSVSVLVLVFVGGVTVVGTAAAHTELSSSDPADGAVLAAPPGAVTLVFDGPMVNIGATVVITGPDGQQYPTGAPVVDSTDVRTDIPGLGPAGPYMVSYRVVSGDGHPVEGQIQFQLEPPAPAPIAPVDISTPPLAVASSTPAGTPLPPTASPSSPQLNSTAPPVTGSPATGVVASTGTSATETTVSTTAASEPQGGISGWLWVAAVVVLLLAGVAGAVIIRQRRNNGPA